MIRMPAVTLLLVAVAAMAPSAHADGGAVMASVDSGGRRVTVFVAPVAPRAGTIEVSVLRVGAADSEEEPAPPIMITARLPGGALERSAPMSTRHQGNRWFESAWLDLPAEGRWSIVVDGGAGWPSASFDLEVGPPLPPWRTQWPWLLAWVPLTALLLLRDRLAGARVIAGTRREGRRSATGE